MAELQQGKYTAQEIVEAAGLAAEDIGNVRVRIGGIRGINTPGHVVYLNPGEAEVVVGDQKVAVSVSEGEEGFVSAGARETLDADGKAATEAAEALQAQKAGEAESGDDQSDNQE